MSGRYLLRLTRMSTISKYQERPKSWPPRIYKGPKRIESLGSHLASVRGTRGSDAYASDVALVSSTTTSSSQMHATCPCLNLTHRSPMVTKSVSTVVKQALDAQRETIRR